MQEWTWEVPAENMREQGNTRLINNKLKRERGTKAQTMTADAGAPSCSPPLLPKSSSHVTITSCISHHEGRGRGVSRRIPDTRFGAPAFMHYIFGWVCAFDPLRLALNSEAGTCLVICSSVEGSASVSCDTFNVMAWSVTTEAWFSKEENNLSPRI